VKDFTRAVAGVIGGDERPFVEVELYGETFRALADTGAGVNLIGSHVADFLSSQGVEPRPVEATMRMADGSTQEAGLLYEISGTVGGRTYSMKRIAYQTCPTI